MSESIQSKLEPPKYYAHPALTRYFDHIQSRPAIRDSAKSLDLPFPFVTFDLENAPQPERKVEPPKKKEKAANKPTDTEVAAPAAEKNQSSPAATTEQTASDGKAPKKDKKEKKGGAADESGKKKAGGAKPPPADDSGEPVPSMIDLRVGRIIDSE